MRSVRRRFWVESATGAMASFLVMITLVAEDWIEVVFGTHPDQSSGSLERLVALTFAMIALVAALAARAEWVRWRPTTV